jgi:hypothetical protein
MVSTYFEGISERVDVALRRHESISQHCEFISKWFETISLSGDAMLAGGVAISKDFDRISINCEIISKGVEVFTK